jgi:hypothetical protein
MIEARGLVKRYGSTMAVDDLSFSVRPGFGVMCLFVAIVYAIAWMLLDRRDA